MVHARKIGDQTLTFIVSGKLWRNSLIMQDVETGSLWSHVTGEALEGKLAGKHLELLPSVQTTWSRWLAAHPQTTVLAKERPVAGSRYEKYAADPKRAGLFRTRAQLRRLGAKEMVQGVAWEAEAVAVTDARLSKTEPFAAAETEDGGRLLMLRESDEGVRAWLLPAGALPENLALGDGRLVVGEQSWDPAAAGGREMVVRQAYWFAWVSFYPDTKLLR